MTGAVVTSRLVCTRPLFALGVLVLLAGGCFRSHGLSADGPGGPGGSERDGETLDGAVRLDGHVPDGTPVDHFAHAEPWPRCEPGGHGDGCGPSGFALSDEWCVCHPVCRDSSDCPEPEGATMDAVCLRGSPEADRGGCHLRCEGDADCPDGMWCLHNPGFPISECVGGGSS